MSQQANLATALHRGAMFEAAYDSGENPGESLEKFELDRPVISCESAAKAKDIPLDNELKSLLIACDHGRHIVAHVRGSRRLSLRAVKRALKVREARLADPSDLDKYGVVPGSLCPFNERLWLETQLIEVEVLAMRWVTTNAGDQKRKSYVIFPPELLRHARDYMVGHFEE